MHDGLEINQYWIQKRQKEDDGNEATANNIDIWRTFIQLIK